MSKEDANLIIEYMESRKRDFQRFLKEEKGLSPHAATFIIEDLEVKLKGAAS